MRERAYLYVSKGKAADALKLLPAIERSTSEVLRELEDLGIGLRVTLQEMSSMLAGEAHSAGLPMVYILPEEETAEPFQTIPYLRGTAVFKGDRMVGEISEMITRGILWLRNEIGEYTVVIDMPETEGMVALRPVKANVRLIPSIVDDVWKITVRIWTQGDIIQNSTSLNPTDPAVIAKMDEAYRNTVAKRIRMALDEVQHRLKVDIFGFAESFQRIYPRQWEQVKDRWEQKLPEVKVELDIKANINRPGSISYPGAQMHEEGASS